MQGELPHETPAPNFRRDLLARIDVWRFQLPPLTKRLDDLDELLNLQLTQYRDSTKSGASFTAEARKKYLDFAKSKDAKWPGNLRDFNTSIWRMATLAANAEIGLDHVNEEIDTLTARWMKYRATSDKEESANLLYQVFPDADDRWNYLDRVQLEAVLQVCKSAKNKADAARTLYDKTSRSGKNMTSALSPMLNKLGIDWDDLKKQLNSLALPSTR